MISRFGTLLFALPGLLFAQAAVEHALGTARAVANAGGAQKSGKAIGGTFDKLGQALRVVDKPSRAAEQRGTVPDRRSSAIARSAKAVPEPPSKTFEDPAGIQTGMDSAEVLRRFGPAIMTLTTGSDEETLCYSNSDQNIDVQVRAGTVAAVKKTGLPGQARAAGVP